MILNIFCLVVLLLSSFSIGATSRVRSISFEGNEVTQQSLLRRQLTFTENDVVDIRQIEESAQSIRDTGLFRSVEYYLAEDYSAGPVDEEVVDVVYLLHERYYVLVIPRLKTEENKVHLGIQLQWDNVFGLDHSLRYRVFNQGQVSGVNERQHRITYDYPNINDSKFALNFRLAEDNLVTLVDNAEDQNVIDRSIGLGLFKWLNRRGVNRGWFMGLDLAYTHRTYEGVESNTLYDEVNSTIFGIEYGYSLVHEYSYNRGGRAFGYKLDFADEGLGSDNSFYKHRLYYKSYYRFDSRPDDNLNVQTILGYSTDDILHERAFSLGGNSDLRGYDSDEFKGNTMLLVNMEYLTPDADYPTLRYVVFSDIGNTYDSFSEIKEGNVKTVVGMGIRWKIPAFVNLDFRIDYGVSLSDDSYRVSASSSHAF